LDVEKVVQAFLVFHYADRGKALLSMVFSLVDPFLEEPREEKRALPSSILSAARSELAIASNVVSSKAPWAQAYFADALEEFSNAQQSFEEGLAESFRSSFSTAISHLTTGAAKALTMLREEGVSL